MVDRDSWGYWGWKFQVEARELGELLAPLIGMLKPRLISKTGFNQPKSPIMPICLMLPRLLEASSRAFEPLDFVNLVWKIHQIGDLNVLWVSVIDCVFQGEVLPSEKATSISNTICGFVSLIDTVYALSTRFWSIWPLCRKKTQFLRVAFVFFQCCFTICERQKEWTLEWSIARPWCPCHHWSCLSLSLLMIPWLYCITRKPLYRVKEPWSSSSSKGLDLHRVFHGYTVGRLFRHHTHTHEHCTHTAMDMVSAGDRYGFSWNPQCRGYPQFFCII